MPTRKQKRRRQQRFRHEQAWYEVDEFGNEVELDPDDVRAERAKVEENGGRSKPSSQTKTTQAQRGGRAIRTPPPPSWQRASRRAGLLGVVVFALFYLTSRNGGGGILSVALIALLYTALFIPFTYAIDRYAYNRYLRRTQGGPKPRSKR